MAKKLILLLTGKTKPEGNNDGWKIVLFQTLTQCSFKTLGVYGKTAKLLKIQKNLCNLEKIMKCYSKN